MRRALRVARVVVRLLAVVVVLAVAVPGSGVRPATMSLTKVETADGYDAGADVVWVLVLGADSLGLTDAIQLLGIDARTGAAAAIGIPRDTWVDLGGGEMGKINEAYNLGADVASRVVRELVGIPAQYVLATRGETFVSMVDDLGGVTVDSPLAFTTEVGNMPVKKGPNRFDGEDAFRFADTRVFDVPVPGDFIRVANHQALLLGLLAEMQKRDGDRGFVETMALSSIAGIDTEDASPLDLYRLLNALTGVDPALAEGCVLVGRLAETPAGSQIVIADENLADRLGEEAREDATFESDCPPVV